MFHRLSFGLLVVSTLLVLVAIDAWIAANIGALPGAPDWLVSLLRRGSLIPLAFTAIMLLGGHEFGRLLRSADLRPLMWLSYATIVVLMLSPWVAAGLMPIGTLVSTEAAALQFVWLVVALALAGIACGRAGPTGSTLADVGATLLMITYCGVLPSFLLILRCDDLLPIPHGAWLVLLFLAITKASDIGAFFVGLAIGRHKLAPRISPGKSVEGAIGAVCASAGVGMMLWLLSGEVNQWHGVTPAAGESQEVELRLVALAIEMLETLSVWEWWQALIFSVFMSIFGQAGDMLESAFKRSASAKDSAKLIPEFGGVLDMVDSPIVAAPIAWFLLTHLWGVV